MPSTSGRRNLFIYNKLSAVALGSIRGKGQDRGHEGLSIHSLNIVIATTYGGVSEDLPAPRSYPFNAVNAGSAEAFAFEGLAQTGLRDPEELRRDRLIPVRTPHRLFDE